MRISEDEEILETGGKKYEKTILISVELFLSAFRRRIVSHRLDSSFLALTIRGCVELDKGKSFEIYSMYEKHDRTLDCAKNQDFLSIDTSSNITDGMPYDSEASRFQLATKTTSNWAKFPGVFN